MKKYWKEIVITIIVAIIIVPLIIAFLLSFRLICTDTTNEWIGFWGGYLGAIISGLITLYALYKTFEDNKKNLQETFEHDRLVRKIEECREFCKYITENTAEYIENLFLCEEYMLCSIGEKYNAIDILKVSNRVASLDTILRGQLAHKCRFGSEVCGQLGLQIKKITEMLIESRKKCTETTQSVSHEELSNIFDQINLEIEVLAQMTRRFVDEYKKEQNI